MQKKNAPAVADQSAILNRANQTQLDNSDSCGTVQTTKGDIALQPPIPTGQCAEVLGIIEAEGPVLSLVLTADYAIPEAASRVHDLRHMGFNIITTILREVKFRGRMRRKVAQYSLGVPHWPAPGYQVGCFTPDLFAGQE